MFKRANKITALLVAAASVMSVVPAMAADSSRLGTKDGTVKHAVAYKDGKYLFQGYKNDEDDDDIYYNGGDKDRVVDSDDDDLSSSDIEANLIKATGTTDPEAYTRDGSFGEKYAFTKESSDNEYLIDLTSGKVSDDTPDDLLDTAKTKAKSALKKTDRYGDLQDDLAKLGEKSTTGNIWAVPGVKFDSDTWYEYAVSPVTPQDNSKATGLLYGLINDNGKYVDISNVANIYAYSSKEKKFVKIDEYDKYDTDTDLEASLVQAPEVLAQDKDYFYVKTVVNIVDTYKDAKAPVIDGITTTVSAAKFGDDDTPTKDSADNALGKNNYTRHTYIQKISKAQGDKKDDAWLPKSVQSYEISKSEFDCGDADDAYDAMKDANDFSVVKGQLLAIKYSGHNVKVTTINLKKDKVKYDSLSVAPKAWDDSDKLSDDKVDAYLAEKDDSDDQDVDDASDITPYDVDVDGNVWVVDDGKIYKFENNEMVQKYSCDSSLNSISVYDENNLITWEQDGDIYTTVNEGKAQAAAEAPTTTTAAVKTGWTQLSDGTWTFYDATGTMVVNNWSNVGGVWYYLGANGIMQTGWQQIGGVWYYMNSSGAMQTGWQYVNGSWYYLKTSGAMATGWVNDGGTWYYCDTTSGAMLANTTTPDGYYVNASGAWV